MSSPTAPPQARSAGLVVVEHPTATVVVPAAAAAAVPAAVAVPDETSGNGSHALWNGHERRSQDRVRRLSREFDALCTGAVDAAEIAAGLEFVGFTDGTAREYGAGDVFGLAERLYHASPRLVDRRPGRLANPWAERPLRHLLRGVAFAAPGLLFLVCLPRAGSTADAVVLGIALLLGWPISQTMAFVGHLLEGRRHPLAARGVLLTALVAALLLAAGFAAGAHALGAGAGVAWLALGEIAYLASAAVVIVFGDELVVLAVLAPGLLVAGLSLLARQLPYPFVVGAAALTVAGAGGAAVAVSARARPSDVRVGFASLTSADWVEAGFHAGYGVVGGLLVSLPAMTPFRSSVGSLSLMPVIWSMGLAEWHIVRLRRRAFAMLNEAISVASFRAEVAQLADRSAGRYLTDLSALTVLLVFAVGLADGQPPTGAQIVGYASGWLLGAGFYLALVVSSLGRVRLVVALMALSLALGVLALVTVANLPALLVAPLVLALLLLPALRSTVGDPMRHM